MQRVSAGHYQMSANGYQYDVIKKDIPVINWVILKNGERSDQFPHSIGRYAKARELVYADIEKEESRKAADKVTDPNMAVQHLDTTGTDRPTGNAAGPANTPLENVDTTATEDPGADVGTQVNMGEAESVEVIDDDNDQDVDFDNEEENQGPEENVEVDDVGESTENETPVA